MLHPNLMHYYNSFYFPLIMLCLQLVILKYPLKCLIETLGSPYSPIMLLLSKTQKGGCVTGLAYFITILLWVVYFLDQRVFMAMMSMLPTIPLIL